MTLVIGYGNTLCGDDGVGVAVAEALIKGGLPAHVHVITAHQLYPEMAEAISTAAQVIFVDARADGTPGDISEQRLSPASDEGALVHHMQPGQLLRLALLLYGACPPAHLVTITGQTFDLGSGFSDIVRPRLPDLVRAVKHLALLN